METNQIHFINFINLINDTVWHRWWDMSECLTEGSRLFQQYVMDEDDQIIGSIEVGADFVDAHLTFVHVSFTSRGGKHEELYRADAPQIVIDDVQDAIMSKAC